jgi:pyruvate dehydrogenase E2 component (dihydrolipoamide acetyltransferase)
MPEYRYRLPSLGADMDRGKIVEWLVKPGDTVKKGQQMIRLQTEKALFEGEIWVDGTVRELLAHEGDSLPVGAPLAVLEVDETVVEPVPEKPAEVAAPSSAGEISGPHLRASPAARKRAKELGIDLAQLSVSGAEGVISLADIERTAKKAPPSTGRDAARQAMARLMTRSKKEIPHYYLETTAHLDRALLFLEQENAKRSVTERVLPIALLLAAVSRAVRKVPDINGHWRDGVLSSAPAVTLGFPIALKGGGLVVPGIEQAERKSAIELMRIVSGLVERARTAALRSSDMPHPTLTVTSLGDQGVESIFGVIFPPQVALVGAGRIHQAPVVQDGTVSVASIVRLSLSADHRATEGPQGARFLAEVSRLLTKPEELWETPP